MIKRISVISHDHRAELGLAVDEYIVCMEAIKCSELDIINMAEYISAVSYLPLQKVVNILSHLSLRGLLIDTPGGTVASEEWKSGYNRHYGTAGWLSEIV